MKDGGRTALIVILVLVALPLLWGGAMMSGGMGPGMMWGWQGSDRWNGWQGLLMMVPAVLIIGGIVAVLVWGLGGGPSAPMPPGVASAREILDTRYARGEITREQYQQMKGDLGS